MRYLEEAAVPVNFQQDRPSSGAYSDVDEEAWAMFQQADTNGDGLVDVRELRALLAALPIHASATALVRQFDAGGLGGLDLQAFSRWWAGRNTTWLPAPAPEQLDPDGHVFAIYNITPEAYRSLQTQFLAHDRDRTGTVTALSLYGILTQAMGLTVDWDQFLQSIGGDWADKVMTFEDVLYWWKENLDWPSRSLRGKGYQPRHPPPPSTPAPPQSQAFYKGATVLLLRSSGTWEPSTIQEVKDSSYVVAFSGNTKEIPFRLTERFLRPL
eukprot:TRINITY_DN3421_c0_g1_i1.p1 TRINITY_DN3421_c0_g1~~TRINITY_DN3421_c0_g1_i1.p1  ORF type:complete len:269 (-),score=69.76 TRINITY_DN3421_c0_g1_i1:358-1164(-)